MWDLDKAFWQLVVLFAPLFLCVIALYWIQRLTQKRMSRFFGWRSNLWTGWIGAPVHEYSHAIVAWAFGHRVLKVVPFQPDQATGRLGYVEISYDRKSRWQSLGHALVCYAPLFGGTIMLLTLSAAFYGPTLSTAREVDASTLMSGSFRAALNQMGQIVTLENFATVKFWIFSYLVLSVGCHLSPSSVDVKSSFRSLPLVGLILGIFVLIFFALGGFPESLFQSIASLFLVLQAQFLFTTLLCSMAGLIVYIITELITWLS